MSRCKPGDLAVVVCSTWTPEAIGRFVIVERLAEPNEFQRMPGTGATWMVRSAVSGEKLPARLITGKLLHLERRAMADNSLRPIRPDEGEDEMLRIAGKPAVDRHKFSIPPNRSYSVELS